MRLRWARQRCLAVVGVCGLVLSLALTGCEGDQSNHARPSHPPAVIETPNPVSDHRSPVCTTLGGCQLRFAEATAYVGRQPGRLGVVVRDRQTGQSWSAGATDRKIWTASSIKLAMATDMLERDRSRVVVLPASDKALMAAMLNSSDNAATMALWKKYGNDAQVARWRTRFGMTNVGFVPGFPSNWGYMKASTHDFAALVSYVLDNAAAQIRDYLVSAMQGVAANQRWGIWAAGSAEHPGNKDGWSYEADDGGHNWITNTVGFAGPQQRYVLAVMYQLPPSGTLAQGVHAVSDLVALLFGRPVPTTVTVPEPDG